LALRGDPQRAIARRKDAFRWRGNNKKKLQKTFFVS
jgi:hypothetical protein